MKQIRSPETTIAATLTAGAKSYAQTCSAAAHEHGLAGLVATASVKIGANAQ